MPRDTYFNLPNEKKSRIREAIFSEFSARTYEHVNLSNIVRDANIPRGSLYQYFRDKEDIFLYLLSEIQTIKMERFKTLFDPNAKQPFISRLESILWMGFTFSKEFEMLHLIGTKLYESDYYRTHPIVKQSIEMAIETFKIWIQTDVDKGLIRRNIDVDSMAKIIVRLINQPAYYLKLDDKSIELNTKEIKALIDLIKKGLENHV